MNAIANVAESAQNVWHGRSGRALRERERCRAGALLSRQRADTLFSLGPKRGAQLVMPRLGEPVEPAHAKPPTPWWRAVDAAPSKLRVEPRVTLPKSTPWPID